jgi:hypothetical protein
MQSPAVSFFLIVNEPQKLFKVFALSGVAVKQGLIMATDVALGPSLPSCGLLWRSGKLDRHLDCRVASLLAMTWRGLQRLCVLRRDEVEVENCRMSRPQCEPQDRIPPYLSSPFRIMNRPLAELHS